MSLKYRGVSYNPSTSLVELSEEVIGYYRGAPFVRHFSKNLKDSHPQGLKYRGAKIS
jgi:hypothetical protein